MLTLAPFTFCANNVPGTDPIRAMDMARRCGFHTIELSAIDGISFRGEDGEIIEIQTRQFNRMRGKLQAFLPLYPVTIVYPIPYEKWLIWIDEDSGELSKKRKSPKRDPLIRHSRNYIRSKCS